VCDDLLRMTSRRLTPRFPERTVANPCPGVASGERLQNSLPVLCSNLGPAAMVPAKERAVPSITPSRPVAGNQPAVFSMPMTSSIPCPAHPTALCRTPSLRDRRIPSFIVLGNTNTVQSRTPPPPPPDFDARELGSDHNQRATDHRAHTVGSTPHHRRSLPIARELRTSAVPTPARINACPLGRNQDLPEPVSSTGCAGSSANRNNEGSAPL